MTPLRVYVAGPYTRGDVAVNVAAAVVQFTGAPPDSPMLLQAELFGREQRTDHVQYRLIEQDRPEHEPLRIDVRRHSLREVYSHASSI